MDLNGTTAYCKPSRLTLTWFAYFPDFSMTDSDKRMVSTKHSTTIVPYFLQAKQIFLVVPHC